MSKFDFNNSRYAAFFNSGEGQQILQSYIDRSEMIRINYNWWRTQFSVAPNTTPTDASGKATFTVMAEKERAANMLDWRAPLGNAHPYSKEGLTFYSASIPDFISDAIAETAMERQYKEDEFAQFGNDANIIRAWTKNVQKLIDAKDQTINYMGAQLQSTGKIIYNAGRGITGPQQKAEIPAENFVNAGEKVWTAPDCKILTQMVQIEQDFRDRTGFAGAMKWLIPYQMYKDVFLQNAEVKEWVNYMRNLNTDSPVAAPEISVILDTMFSNAVANYPGLSAIEIVVEKEKDVNWGGEKFVHGWDPKVAVLRPVGDAGLIQHTTILDQKLSDKFGNNIISTVFGSIGDGFSMLVNSTMADGTFKSWQTVLMASATPSLTEFPEHVIVDTSTAQ